MLNEIECNENSIECWIRDNEIKDKLHSRITYLFYLIDQSTIISKLNEVKMKFGNIREDDELKLPKKRIPDEITNDLQFTERQNFILKSNEKENTNKKPKLE